MSTTAVLVMSGFAAGAALAQQPAETAIPDKVRLFIPYKDYSAEDNQRVLEMYKWLRVSIGSSNILSWKKLGMVGLVTSGGLADTDEIIYHKVPVWFRRYARGFRPGRNELESVNRPVTIGGVLVRPGDVVVADGDGVVVVPRERAEEVAKAALPFLDNVTRERYINETGQNPSAKKPGG